MFSDICFCLFFAVLTTDFSMQAVKSQIDAAQKVAGGNGSEQDIAEAKIELEV